MTHRYKMKAVCHVFCAIMTHMYKMITIKQRLPNLEGNCHINSMHLTGGVVIQFVIQILAIKTMCDPLISSIWFNKCINQDCLTLQNSTEII